MAQLFYEDPVEIGHCEMVHRHVQAAALSVPESRAFLKNMMNTEWKAPMRSDLTFRKSSYSQGRTENRVEVADSPTGAAVRDTQNREAGHLEFSAPEWSALLRVTWR